MLKYALIILIATVVVACDSNIVVGEMRELPGSWHKDETLQFELPVLDSLKQYNIFLHLRNTNDYPYNNIFLIATIEFPYGKTVTDTLEYRMAAPDGTWLGTGIGMVKESKLWYKEGVQFFEDGMYTLTISQAVRNIGEVHGVSQLDGIIEVGYSIEEANLEE
ncbi:MAG: gliding motility lipoprotein GldH [Bacteroidia bacterium]|nr:gliding motility lipoprotein GldH [Bacteroidia bacterium]NNM22674.1 gliding motility lipoprotein GldH [Flavobacteriaceae bacterium]